MEINYFFQKYYIQKLAIQHSMKKKFNPVLILSYLTALVLTFLIFRPFLASIILGMVLVMFLYPVNNKLKQYIKNPSLRSLAMLGLTIMIVIIPMVFMIISVTDQARSVYNEVSDLELGEVNQVVEGYTGFSIDVEEQIMPIITDVRDFLTGSIRSIITYASELLIKVFVMFFVLYYGFKEGDKMVRKIMELLPFSAKHKKELLDNVKNVIWGVLYGQLLVAILQGFAGGVAFWILGLPNPMFWGLVMGILSFIPLLGPPIVWVPAAIISFYQSNIWTGVILIIFGVLIMNIDNILKPKLIGSRVGLHPLIILVGILGGIALFGVIGFIIGPIVLSLSLIMIRLFNEEYL